MKISKTNYSLWSHSPEQYLDMVLTSLSFDKASKYTPIELNGILLQLFQINLGEKFVGQILEQLKKDGYAEKENDDYYKITFSGIFFRNSLGYTKKKMNNEIELNRIISLENENVLRAKTQIKLNEKLNRLTFWIVLFAFLSLGWTIWESTHFFCFGH